MVAWVSRGRRLVGQLGAHWRIGLLGGVVAGTSYGIVVWAMFFLWAMLHRFRVGWLERQLRVGDLDEAIAARRAEAVDAGGDA